MSQRLLTVISFIYLAILAIPVHAEPGQLPWYQVELLVFEPTYPPHTNEKWSVVVEEPAITDVVELTPPARSSSGKPVAFRLLRKDQYGLKSIAEKIQRNNANKVLLHIAWLQPLEENTDGTTVHVHSGLNDYFLSAKERALKEERKRFDSLGLENSAGTIGNDSAGLYQGHFIDGTVKLILSRYLHLKAHMIYFNPEVDLARQVASHETTAPTVEKFLLKESRRVRRQEVHYLDHPYFGVIARVTRYEK